MLWGLPAALLLLAGAIPLILFLHSLKPRGLKIATTTMFVWQRVLRERPLGTRLGWLLAQEHFTDSSIARSHRADSCSRRSVAAPHCVTLRGHDRRARPEREHEGEG